MMDQQIEFERPAPWGIAACFTLTIALLGLGVGLNKIDWAIAAILPAALTVALLLTRQPDFAARFTADALEVQDPPATIPYESIEGVVGDVRATREGGSKNNRAFPILVHHRGGHLQIPARLNRPSAEVYQFLKRHMPGGGSREVDPSLAGYLRRQVEAFGEDRVFSFVASPQSRRIPAAGWRLRASSLAAALTGIAWAIFGASLDEDPGWLPGGLLLCINASIAFGLSFAIARAAPTRSRKQWANASLVLGPLGLAMVQLPVRGEMTWQELRDVRLKNIPTLSRWINGWSGLLVLKLEGVEVFIADIYDQPIATIHERIVEYWR